MRRATTVLILLVATLVAVAPVAGAEPTATWTKAPSGPPIIWDATAFAGSTCQLVQFGGTTGYATPSGTNLFDPAKGTWTTIAAPRRGGPSARTLARMAWDPVRKRVVLFGGRDAAGVPLQDTWVFDPVTRVWTAAATDCRRGGCPPARFGHGMAWSSAIGKVLVFGGQAGRWTRTTEPMAVADTWTFDGSRWQQLGTTNPPPGRLLFGMAEDAATGEVLVYGGVKVNNAYLDGSLWILDPSTRSWDRKVTATVPEARAEVGMAWVGSLGAVVLSTGGTTSGCMSWTNSSWAYDRADEDWRRVATTDGPPTARNEGSLTANSCDGSAILIGGTGTNQLPIDLEDRAWIIK